VTSRGTADIAQATTSALLIELPLAAHAIEIARRLSRNLFKTASKSFGAVGDDIPD
jgi:hypothetical protein